MTWTTFEQRLQKRMEREHIPGVAIAVSKKGQIIYQKGFGVKQLDTNEPVTPQTVFGTASITKSVTALVIMKLVEEGKLSIDDPVVTYLPNFRLASSKSIEKITIHHLLTHSTGLAPIERKEELPDFQAHIDYVADHNHILLGEPGDYFSYCNDTFLLLGAIIERVTGKNYRNYVTETLLKPLQMNRSTFRMDQVHNMTDVSTPYVFDQTTDRLSEVEWPRLGNYEVGGGLRSTVLDLMKYGELYMNRGRVGDRSLISESALKKMWQPYMKIDRHTSYGYGFKVTQDAYNCTLVEHSGGQQGVSSNFGFVPEKDLVVAVLTNVSEATANGIWLEAVNTALNRPIDEPRGIEPTFDFPVELQGKWIGTYGANDGTRLHIFIADGDLKAQVNADIFSLRASDEATLVTKETEKPIRFFYHDDGEPWALFFGMKMLLRMDE